MRETPLTPLLPVDPVSKTTATTVERHYTLTALAKALGLPADERVQYVAVDPGGTTVAVFSASYDRQAPA